MLVKIIFGGNQPYRVKNLFLFCDCYDMNGFSWVRNIDFFISLFTFFN
jgi:hypothetical protein